MGNTESLLELFELDEMTPEEKEDLLLELNELIFKGTLVRLLERLPDGRLRVTIDNIDFVMLPSEVTTDLDAARDAERRYFDTLRAQR